MTGTKSERSDLLPKASVKKSERSDKEQTSDIDRRIMAAIRSQGSISAYYCKKHLAMKYDTAKSHLDALVKKGILYTKPMGNYTYYTLVPDGNKIGTFPPKPASKKGKVQTDGVGSPSVITRAASPSEVIRAKGFVCHPKVSSDKIGNDFIRCHHNGQYQVKIVKKGKMEEGTHYVPIANTDSTIAINWSFTDLSLNTSCYCKIKFPSDKVPFTLRTVSSKDGALNLMSIWVHPRYIFNIGVIPTAKEEFLQQVRDLLPILVAEGWEFGDEILVSGDHHYAFNDRVLGGIAQSYERQEGCPIEFDHSHGVNEMEVIEQNGDAAASGALVESIANLPQFIRDVTESFEETTKALVEINRQVQILAKTQVDAISAMYPRQSTETSSAGGMYGQF